MDNRRIVYQSYGNEYLISQAMFSITSLLKNISADLFLDIWIYTDKKNIFTEFFGKHPRIFYREVTLDQIRLWRGKIDFIHRVKIEILKDAASQFKGSLFYCDGDTYFLACADSIFLSVNDRICVMHFAETQLIDGVDPLTKKILKFCRKHQFEIGSERVSIGPSTTMWNAGFLGISEKNKSFLPLVLELTDKMYGISKRHVMEQLAFSFFLQTRCEIRPANQIVFHYWNQKIDFQTAIDDFLKKFKNIESALENYSMFLAPSPLVPKVKKRIGKWIFKTLKLNSVKFK